MRAATIFAGLAIAAMGVSSGSAQTTRTKVVQKVVTGETTKAVAGGDAQSKAIIAACSDRRFESTAEVVEKGKKRVTHIKLCAKPGESDATWVKSLEQAAPTIKGSSQLPAERRAKIVADLDAEIARVAAGADAPASESK